VVCIHLLELIIASYHVITKHYSGSLQCRLLALAPQSLALKALCLLLLIKALRLFVEVALATRERQILGQLDITETVGSSSVRWWEWYVTCAGMIYPEFRSRTPPPTYSASVLEYEDCRRPRRLSCEDVEMFPNVSTSDDVEPVPATPPPAYRGRRGAVRTMPVYCPRALRSRPPGFVANDSTRPATSGSSSATSSESGIVGKWMSGFGRGVTAANSLKPESSADQSASDSRSTDDRHAASCSTNDS